MPGVEVAAQHYPPGALKQAFSGLVTLAQWSVILASFSGESVAAAVAGTPLLDAVKYCQENKMMAGGGAWFVGSSVSASLLKTGAFEVTVQGGEGEEPVTVWSGKARGGRPPKTHAELQDIVDALRAVGVGASSDAYI